MKHWLPIPTVRRVLAAVSWAAPARVHRPRLRLGHRHDRYGFGTEVHAEERTYSEATAREIDEAVKAIVDGAYSRTLALLKSRRQVLERGARLLLEKETLTESDLRALLAEDRPAAAQ